MKINFKFKNLKPVSTNQLYCNNQKTKRRFKTGVAKKFERDIFARMLMHKPEIFDFEKHFSPYDHFLIGYLIVFIPKSILITRKGYISHKSGDVNNHKAFTDNVFKAFDKLDDKYLIIENQYKLISPDNNFHMGYSLEIQDQGCLDKWSNDAYSLMNEGTVHP